MLAKGGTPDSHSSILALGGVGNPNLRLRKSIDLNLTKEELEVLDVVAPHAATKNLMEFQARLMVMNRRVAALLQNELTDKEKEKKAVEEVTARKKKVEVDQT